MGNKNIGRYFVLGCGQTGTTMISGILHINGYRTSNINNLFENQDLVDRKIDNVIERFIGKKINFGFIQLKKRSSKPTIVSKKLESLYQSLNEKYI